MKKHYLIGTLMIGLLAAGCTAPSKSNGNESVEEATALAEDSATVDEKDNTAAPADETVLKLKNFYEAYWQAFEEMTDTTDFGNKVEKALQLVRENCTPQFAAAMEDEVHNGVGWDFVTQDLVDCMDISTLSVSKADDHYVVSFYANVTITTKIVDGKKVMSGINVDGGQGQYIKLAVDVKDGLIDNVDIVL